VAFASRALAERLLRGLRGSGVAPHRVSVLAESATGRSRERVWRSADPFTEKALSDRVWWQLRAWVESGGIPGGITRIRIAPADLSDEGRQLGLLQDESSRIEAERALARAQALLGPDGVLQGRAQGGRSGTMMPPGRGPLLLPARRLCLLSLARWRWSGTGACPPGSGWEPAGSRCSPGAGPGVLAAVGG
jgi:hypothetical protein